ncbi:MAG: hypothetical protein CM1200mP32_04850 [Methanobacteriota archaeon]|nr:MAG: hypothetical protein CM1200mP32_04850 [Euryarchaeota archaeon]
MADSLCDLFGHTPEQVREMGTEERSTLLAHHNLEITQAELARCREAIRDSSIWQLAERRSHASPHLRNAFEWVLEQFEEIPDGPVGDSALELLASTDPLRKGGERLSEDIGARPYILHLHALLSLRWRPPGSWWDGSGSGPERVVLIEGTSPPWRHSAMGAAVTELLEEPSSVVMLSTPLGPIPFSLEDVSPWCHLDCPEEVWSEAYEDEEVKRPYSRWASQTSPSFAPGRGGFRTPTMSVPCGLGSTDVPWWTSSPSYAASLLPMAVV